MVFKKHWYYIIIILLIAAVFLFFSISSYLKSNQKKALQNYNCPDCNIVLISVDTLRADHVSSFGYYRKTTPNIDKFFQNGIFFKNTTSASSWTLPVMMSVFTGLFPSHHQVTNKLQMNPTTGEIENMALSSDKKTIASVLQENGYKTGSFTGGAALSRIAGFDRGFDTYYDKKDFGGFADSIDESLKWIEENKDNKMFIFLHGYDVHGEFSVNFDKRFVKNYKGTLTGSAQEHVFLREEGLFRQKISLTQDDVQFLTDLYDEKIQRMDTTLNKFFEEYPKITNRKTIFIFMSDHGEELYERGQIDHGHSLYNELLNVPLIIKLPGIDKKITYTNQVSNLDIFPTIAKLTNINPSISFDGFDIFNSPKHRTITSETQYRYVVDLKSQKADNGWKIIKDITNNKFMMFNTIFDYKEKNNLYDTVQKVNNKPFNFTNLGPDF